MPFTKIQMVTGLFLCTLLISACNNAATPPKNNTPDTSNKIIQINSDLYTLPLRDQNTEQYNYAVNTSAGIVWLPAPKMNIAPGTEANPFYFPTEPFTFYLSSPNEKTLAVEKSKKLLTLPLNDGDAVLVVSGVFGLDDYILYHTFSIFTDGAQPIREQAWVMKVDDPTSNKEIAQFHSSGGKFYSYAVDEKEKFYLSVSILPGNADGSYSYEVYIYNLLNGNKEKINDYSLNPSSLDSIQFTYNNKKYSYKLQSK
ncbi:hypothetical protein BSK62_13605 [Paenibacillus odorifer]|uniref:hypothetical protein n=1 Tax=Paenibacillus TaxID=44249 RepID=UPI00096C5DF2|nr:hypothetical protein [Paenibacillus odorifer]OMC64668.1 hypothetical protein BK121_24760 [Paenibacillus odorifer]OMD65318.1 hypothetical protein BSK62_13605 [Paenibacillus odorifer]